MAFGLVSVMAHDSARHLAMLSPRCPAAGFRSALPIVYAEAPGTSLHALLACPRPPPEFSLIRPTDMGDMGDMVCAPAVSTLLTMRPH
jgi:hypothetical protein